MNLGKLLRASTSIFGGGEAIAYRLSKGGALPKFNEGKKPFGLKASEAPEPVKAGVKAAPAVAPVQKTPPPYAFKPAFLAQENDVRRQAVAAPADKPAKQGWTTRLNPFRAPEPEAVQTSRPVQAELSLDAVKVIHNDLADADVEVVPVKSNTDATVSAPILPPARRAWEYLGESLMRG